MGGENVIFSFIGGIPLGIKITKEFWGSIMKCALITAFIENAAGYPALQDNAKSFVKENMRAH